MDILQIFSFLIRNNWNLRKEIPKATIPYNNTNLNNGDFIQLIEVYMATYRDEYKNEMERK